MKTTVKIIAAILAVLSPVLLLLTAALCVPPVYEDSFVGALDEKYERLYSIEEEKLVIVGGSSVAFGYDSEILEKYMEMPVVNFGLYAALGTKVMMDLSRDAIGEGDVVLLAPELDAQTLSLYFNAETMWQASEGAPRMLRHLDADDTLSMLGGMWKYATDKIAVHLSGESPAPDGVYAADSFDARGDIVYQRDENIMKGYYAPNGMLSLTPDILSDAFVDYVNEYIEHCQRQGASVYFVYCPMNERGLAKDADPEAFETYLRERIACPFLGSITDHIFEAGYFYDTNLHLNDAGAVAHTVAVTRALLIEREIPRRVSVEVPEAPELPMIDLVYEGEDENAKYFTFEMSEEGMLLTGLSDLGKTMQTLTVPVGYDGYLVTSIASGALAGGVLETLILPENSRIFAIQNGAFTDSGLCHLVLGIKDESSILPPTSFSGVADGFLVHVPEGSTYIVGYFWSERGLTFVSDAAEYLP